MPSSHPHQLEAAPTGQESFYDVEVGKQPHALEHRGLHPSIEWPCLTVEKKCPLDRLRAVSMGNRAVVLLVSILGWFILVKWLGDGNLVDHSWEEVVTAPALPLNIVTYAPRDAAATPSPIPVRQVFQVYQPVFTPSGPIDDVASNDGTETTESIAPTAPVASCDLLLMEHSFAYSFGLPFIGDYVPPPCKFNRVVMNFTVAVKGRQFDRLASMFFNDTEVWRTSTAEPTANGIRWTYIKDMSEYLYFWNSPQKLIFDLANLVDSTYTGIYNTTLTATFFTTEDAVDPAPLIIPISSRQGSANQSSFFALPSDNATNTVSFPRNANRAVFTVSACGQSEEEFWWSNVLQSDTQAFEPADGTLYGFSPFREVQVLIDGTLAGVQWPFPIIFTGGVSPAFWSPIVGLDAFDLREHEIDITPWLPLLCDGAEHTFEIRVAGIQDDGKSSGTLTDTVGSSWYVTGKIFVWLDAAGSITRGTTPNIMLQPPQISISRVLTQDSTGANETLMYTANVKRDISISSEITTKSGTKLSTWSQTLSATNFGLITDYGNVQQNNQSTTGTDQSSGSTSYKSSYSFPLYANTSFYIDPFGNYTIVAALIRGIDLSIEGNAVFPTGVEPYSHIPRSASLVPGFSGSRLATTQNGTSQFNGNTAGHNTAFGSTDQVFTFVGLNARGGVTELFRRDVGAVNGTVTKDFESLVGVEVGNYVLPVPRVGGMQTLTGITSPKIAIGRGPGLPKSMVQGGGGN